MCYGFIYVEEEIDRAAFWGFSYIFIELGEN
jgi:hypothetical protein